MHGQQNKKSRENILDPKDVPLFIDGDSSLTYLPRRWRRHRPPATQNRKSFTNLIKKKIIRVKPITKGTAPSIYKYHYNYESGNPYQKAFVSLRTGQEI
jgi:hypothetical protein